MKTKISSLVVRFDFAVFELTSEPREKKVAVFNIHLIDAMVSDLHCLISFLAGNVFLRNESDFCLFVRRADRECKSFVGFSNRNVIKSFDLSDELKVSTLTFRFAVGLK